MKKIHRKGTDSFIFRWMIILGCVFLIVFSALIYLLLQPRDVNSQEFYTKNFQIAYSGYPNFFNPEIYEPISLPLFYSEITSPYFLAGYYYRTPYIYIRFPIIPLNTYYWYFPKRCYKIDGLW